MIRYEENIDWFGTMDGPTTRWEGFSRTRPCETEDRLVSR